MKCHLKYSKMQLTFTRSFLYNIRMKVGELFEAECD
nr:MAG TPA: hypothetical protein [Caudoviricetes sp.]